MRYAINRDQFEQASINKKIQDAKPFDFTQEGIRTAFLRNKYSIVATIWVGNLFTLKIHVYKSYYRPSKGLSLELCFGTLKEKTYHFLKN